MIYYILIILIIILILIIVLYLITQNDTQQYNQSKELNLSELNTGDLLFVRYDNHLGYFMRAISGSVWTHSAMIYKDSNDNIYVMETANYPRSPKHKSIKHKGVLFMSIYDWLIYNKHSNISVMKLESPENYNKDDILFNFSKIDDKELDAFGPSWLRLIFKKEYNSKELNENITCYELVVHLLQESNIAEKTYSPSSYFPKDIINGKLKLKDGFKYTKLRKLNLIN